MAATHTSRPGRNEPCHCGSEKKYKHCCLVKDQEAEREAREKEAKKAAAKAKREAKKAAEKGEEEEAASEPTREHGSANPAKSRHGSTSQPWKRGSQQGSHMQKRSMPQRKGG